MPAQRTSGRWKPGDREQVAVVSFSHTIQHAYVAALGIVYPFALAEFHTSYAVLGIVLGIAGVAGALLQGLAAVVKRYSARVMLGAQNLGMALASVLGALSPGMTVFSIVRVFGSLAAWPQHPIGSAHLTERVPQRRGFVLSAHTTGGNVGTLVAPLGASAVIAVANWRWALGALGIVMAIGSIVVWARVRAAPQHHEAPGSRPQAPPPESPAPLALRTALRGRTAVAVLAAGTISGAGRGLGVLTTYVPAYLRVGLHEPTLTVGVLVTVLSAGAVLGPMVFGHVSDRAGRRPVLYTIYLVGAAAMTGFVLIGSNVFLLGVVGACVGVFTYSEQPIRQALFSDAMQGVPARQAFGAFFAISQSIGSVWITVIGVVVTAAGFRVAFFLMAGSLVAAGMVIALFARDRPATPASPLHAGPLP